MATGNYVQDPSGNWWLISVDSTGAVTTTAVSAPPSQAAAANYGSTITLQQVVNSMRAYPELTPIFGTSGWSQEPALTIANDTIQRFFAQNLDWKFNRAAGTTILTVALQQDYVTNITNLSWLEQAWRIDINNTVNPKPIFSMESVRDLAQTSYQANPFNVSWVPNSLAVLGTWKANTAYKCSYGQYQTPTSPIQQFMDANGNILFIDPSPLKLSINTPGVGSPSFVAPGAPYGTSGSVQPVLPASSAAGTTVVDGTVTWTVADPNGIAIRLAPIPATSGIPWLIVPVYQKKPPKFTSLQQTISPIPDEFAYLFRQGFLAMCYENAGSKLAIEAYQKWQEALFTALRSADREREDACFYPSESLMGGGPYKYGMPIGPSWPFDYWGQ